MIVFNGKCSDDFGVIVEHYPSIVFPEKKIITYEIPGRNGTMVLDEGAFANYDQSYDVFFDAKDKGGLNAVIPQIASWLLACSGYQRLEDSYTPDFYRKAYVNNAHEFLSYFHEYGRGKLTFNCQPERYYKSGEKAIEVLNGQTLYNPTDFKACPIYDFSNYSTRNNIKIMLTENGVTRSFNIKPQYYYNDSRGNIIDVKNFNIPTNSFEGNFEDLKLGKETTITWDGNMSSIKIIPNWWTI